ncbi:MAG TPA: Sir2 family NAD-dependent protein deacetylase [bacterium]|nr:Sir2 family NAD-dependent protein deacetylase [bacterium]
MIDEIIKKIKNSKNIIIVAGAGISTAAGIPDFRTPGTGLYHNLQKYNLPYPEAIFEINYFCQNPKPFFELTKELLPLNFNPTNTHKFFAHLEKINKLLRVYTQNIDGLERLAGVTKLIECHGSFFTATCLKCRKKYQLDEIKVSLLEGNIPYCNCSSNAVIKPDVVFFGEQLPEIFYNSITQDFNKCDLLIIIGTSLQVYPVAGLVNFVKSNTDIIVINKEYPALTVNPNIVLLDDCEKVSEQLLKKLNEN